MFASNDVLYRIHLRQCVRRELNPLAYAVFCRRLPGQTDTDLTQLLVGLPQHEPRWEVEVRVRSAPKFALGQLFITPAAAKAIPHEEVLRALARHVCGDWGLLESHDRDVNERALADGGRLVSVYQAAGGCRYYIITEAGGMATTVLLPEDC